MLSGFRAVVFDFDGVLADSETLQARAWRQVADEFKIPNFSCPVEKIAGRQDIKIAPDLFPPPDDADACMKRKWAIEDQLEQDGQMLPIPGAFDLLHRLAKTHQLAIASSRWQHKIERWLNRHERLGLFNAIVGQQPNLLCKPSPAPYLRALELLDVESKDACAIEDSPTGITAAKAAGLFTIQLCHSHMAKCPSADSFIDSLNSL